MSRIFVFFQLQNYLSEEIVFGSLKAYKTFRQLKIRK